MSTAIVLPTLTQWAQGHITAINKATNDKDLSRPLDDFLSKNATIVVNISRAEYEKQLQGEKFQEIGATVSFLGAVQVLADKDKLFDAGSVGLFYNALIIEAIKVHGAHVTRKYTASVNVIIEQDPSIPKPPGSPGSIHGFSMEGG